MTCLLKSALVLLVNLAILPAPQIRGAAAAMPDAKAAAENPEGKPNDGSALKITLADAILMALSKAGQHRCQQHTGIQPAAAAAPHQPAQSPCLG